MKPLYLRQIVAVVLYITDGSSNNPENDYFPHTALQKVPAKLGGDVELRCTKIIERQQDDVRKMTTYSCEPLWDKDCYHVWTKDGTILNRDGRKYDTKSIITYDYCENFEWTTNLIKKFGPIVNVNTGKDKSLNKDMACFASALTIRNVTLADFGEYKCNMSNHKTDFYRRESMVQNITLYDVNDSTTKQPEAVEYFQKSYTKDMKGRILVQCVTTGGKLVWKMDNGGVNGSMEDSSLHSSVPLEELKSKDFWRCFNYSINSHTPHKGITESFVYFDNVCPYDNARIWCSVDDKDSQDEKSASAHISEKLRYGDSYNYDIQRREDAIGVGSVTIATIVVALLIVFSIIAIVRAKVCGCCGGMP